MSLTKRLKQSAPFFNGLRKTRRIATPDIRQSETAECGLAALAILLAYYGRPVPLEQLRAEVGSTRLGLSARTLLHLARSHGMQARAYRKEPEGLAALGFPLIVHSRFIHFLVVEGITTRDVLVNDPAAGPRAIPWEMFADDFTGIAITLRPLAPAPPFSGRGWFVRVLARYLRPHGTALLLSIALAALASLATIAAALAAGGLVDGRAGAMPAVLGALTLLLVADWLHERLSVSLGARMAQNTASHVLAQLLDLPNVWFSRRSTGVIAAAPTAGLVFQDALGAVLLSAEVLLRLLPLAIAALLIDPTTALGPVVTALLAGLTLVAVQGRRGALAGRLHAAVPGPVMPDAGTLRALDTYRVGGRGAELFGLLAGRHAAGLTHMQQAAATHARLAALRHGLAAMGLALTIALGLIGLAEQHLSVGDIVAVAILCFALHRPLGALQWQLPDLDGLKGALHRLQDTQITPLPSIEPVLSPHRPNGHLQLIGASFRPLVLGPEYLDPVHLTIEPGQQIGIVGPSGSGKSILAKLACGLLDCKGGQVLLDGYPVAVMARRYPGAVAFVDRYSPVGPGSVADTLRLGDMTLSDAALLHVLDLVALGAELTPRGGLALVLSSGATELSGGQRRRIALARALLRSPVLLVLDEILDALEPTLDRLIRSRLRHSGCTLLVISNRRMTLSECDQVIELGKPNAVHA